ncbi:P-loop containing nucleoside triphosphate hydrolase protein [Stachybotrys elegans]|uniref:P-loop containing nucleoside triphosphate hydrolase protein n=1 Tax=Stachybotrys elegans TaxID=80388 RepID=A0A8K0WVN1_9HYPO|nr:P-loop containing nucleoside triphosphate hydrolase protein [Stachybotrys elegans]
MELGQDLGDRRQLDKIDALRGLQIHDIALPQSSGKSSVLESITGFNFPRSVGLCTRHATEIRCRRADTESVTVKIAAATDSPQHHKDKLNPFCRTLSKLDHEAFSSIFKEAAEIMGIGKASGEERGSAFSEDVLQVEINGPNADHLTIIDVPGMFENVTPGVTEDGDIPLVKNMVKRYITDSRTIILAVVPCNGDIANQKILTLAKDVDPEGKRTLGVLTKPDLAVERASQDVIVELVNGKRRDIQLGYCVVKNRGADDLTSTAQQRDETERQLFAKDPWSKLPKDRLGISALKSRIQHLLLDRTKTEFPKVVAEVMAKLRDNKQQLKMLGKSRITTEEQRGFLGKVASTFTQFKINSLDARYKRDKFLSRKTDLRLVTHIRAMNELYSEVMVKSGHRLEFDVGGKVLPDMRIVRVDLEEGPDAEDVAQGYVDVKSLASLYGGKPAFPLPGPEICSELEHLLARPYRCSAPLPNAIMTFIEDQHSACRGYEIGTFNSDLVRGIFKEQAMKWEPITLAHVSNVVLVLHHFIRSILEESCPDADVRASLWNHLTDDLETRYKKAITHAEFLLEVELEGTSVSHDPRFNELIADAEAARHDDTASADENTGADDQDTDVEDDICERIHDSVYAFYNVSRSRFVDVVCQHVIDHFLLHSSDGPLAVLSADAVLSMSPETLEMIAGEDLATRNKRDHLTGEISRLNEALKVLKF